MRKLYFLLILFAFLISPAVRSINPPVTSAGVVVNATTVPGAVAIPVTVKNFVNIGKFTLTMKFDTSVIKYVGAVTHPSFSGMSVVYSVQCSYGKLLITWTGGSGITLPDFSHLMDLTFTFVKGSTGLIWSYSGRVGWCSGTCTCSCQYYQYVGASLVLCTDDTPKSSFYIDGGVSDRSAPVIFAPVMGNAVNGNYNVPLTVNGFTGITSVSLELVYDSTILSYIGQTPNDSFNGNLGVGSNLDSLTFKKISIGWADLIHPVTLANGSTLSTLNFNYSSAQGGFSTLNWHDIGPSCEYNERVTSQLYRLIDYPTSTYYKNGLIYSSGQFAAQAILPVITTASPGAIAIPVNVNNFKNIKSFTLSFLYDPAVMTYAASYTQNPSLTGSFAVTDLLAPNSKRKITITWTGSGLVTLPNGSTAVTLNFTYISGASSLSWKTDSSYCRFNDAAGNAYYDLPKANYYQDGAVASHVAPVTAAWYASGTIGQPVTVPVKVYHYSDIGTFNLTLLYDPTVLTYQSATLGSPIGGTFTPSTPGLGQLLLSWSGTAGSLADSSTLVNITFLYNGGSTALQWLTGGTSCAYTEGIALPALYDLPKSVFYINGYIGPDPVIANFSVSNVTPGVNDTVTFTDLSTGSPNGWNWSITPSAFLFVNGTTSSSQNPQVSFTQNGVYTVTLVASRDAVSNMKIRPAYVHVGTPGLWTGITSTDWSTASNWHNYLVPLSSVNVLVPSAAPNWPLYTGDLVMGAQCKNLTLNGASFLTVTGSFTINGGNTLSFTGSATLKVGASWSDSGSFIPGTGTVEFYGSAPGSILTPLNETFFNLTENKSAAVTLTVPHTVVVNGVLTVK